MRIWKMGDADFSLLCVCDEAKDSSTYHSSRVSEWDLVPGGRIEKSMWQKNGKEKKRRKIFFSFNLDLVHRLRKGSLDQIYIEVKKVSTSPPLSALHVLMVCVLLSNSKNCFKKKKRKSL